MGIQLGATLAILAPKLFCSRFFEGLYDTCLLKTSSWRLPGSIFEAPGAILEPPKLDFDHLFDFNHFWNILGRFLPSKSSKTCLLKSTVPKMRKLPKMRIPMLIVIFRTGGSEKSYPPCGNAKHVLSFPAPVSISLGVCVFQVRDVQNPKIISAA